MSDEPTSNGKPPPDHVLKLGAAVILLSFVYLFLEVWYPVKQGSAVFGLIMLVAGFYFGAAYQANKQG